VLLKIICWVLGEYGLLSPTHSAEQLVTALAELGTRPVQRGNKTVSGGEETNLRALALTAIAKVWAHARLLFEALPSEVQALVRHCSSSRDVDLQQRAHELTVHPRPIIQAHYQIKAKQIMYASAYFWS
jgi:hypothetical protein